MTDVMALGALARLRAGGLQMPADIALAGFDDIPLAHATVSGFNYSIWLVRRDPGLGDRVGSIVADE